MTRPIADSGFALRVKRKDTLEAWNKWSDDTRDKRRIVSDVMGIDEISEDQARALTEDYPLHHLKTGEQLSHNERRVQREHVVDILNGLERLAVGVKFEIYDLAVLRQIGATIIVRYFQKFEPYIVARRKKATDKTRQSRAYVELEELVKVIKDGDDKQAIDEARLEALHQPPS